jgi:hypothetical protein
VQVATQKELLKQLQVLCEFCQKEGATGVDVEYVFQVLEEPKDDRIWEPPEVQAYQAAVRGSLRFVSMATTVTGFNMEIEPPRRWHRLVNDGERVRLVTRRTTGPRDTTRFRLVLKDRVEGSELPLLTYRAIEILTKLPPGALRVCRAYDCDNVFASLHSTKLYCSPRCRNRMGVYAARGKLRGKLPALKMKGGKR